MLGDRRAAGVRERPHALVMTSCFSTRRRPILDRFCEVFNYFHRQHYILLPGLAFYFAPRFKFSNMRAASRLLYATHASAKTTPLRPAPLALLPPIPLYRRLLRVHRYKLSPEERILGDQYIKSEFRAHRSIDNPVHIVNRPRCYYRQCGSR